MCIYVSALSVQGLPEFVPRHWEIITGYNYRTDAFVQHPPADSILREIPSFPRSPELGKVEVIYLVKAEVDYSLTQRETHNKRLRLT